MVTHIATCGDSFGVGCGLPDETSYEQSFAGVVASAFNLPQKVYARSGCCNFTIFLQVKKILEQMQNDPTYKPFVLITVTFHERLIFPLDDGFTYKKPDLSDVEYMSYIPYFNDPEELKRKPEFNPNPEPRLFTETVSNIQYYGAGKAPGIANLFKKVNSNKFEAIKHYFLELFDTGVKKDQDDALYAYMHLMLKKANVPHLLIGLHLPKEIEPENRLNFSWGDYTQKYPDDRGSGHCSAVGNRLVGDEIIKHIKQHGLI